MKWPIHAFARYTDESTGYQAQRPWLVDSQQYLTDLERFGYRDARAEPHGRMTEADIAIWTNAIGEKK